MPEFGWLVLLDAPDPRAVPVGPGHLLVTVGRAKPRRRAACGPEHHYRGAVRVEPALIGDGPALAVSLVLPPRGARLLFDDPAVVGAMKAVLREPHRAPLFSTLVDGSTHWAGSISGTEAPDPAWWEGDPFARLGPQIRVEVPAGVLRAVPLPAGPGHQRHAGAPWPWGRF